MSDSRPAVETEPGLRVMFSGEQIQARVREMGLELARDYAGKRPLFVAVLKGACMFQCDLARATPIDLELDFLAVSSYGRSTTSSGVVKLIMDLRSDISGRHLVLCEGVVDSGLSVQFILDLLKSRGAASIKVAALLCVGFVVGSYFGGAFANQVPGDTLRKIFGAVLLIISAKMILGK